MRRIVIAIVAVGGGLLLGGCGDDSRSPSAKPVVSTPAATRPEATDSVGQQWDVRVVRPELQALSDLTARLIEHGFSSYIARKDGIDQVMIGPFSSRAEAELKQAQLASRLDIASDVIEHP